MFEKGLNWDAIYNYSIQIGLKIIIATVILIIGFWISKMLSKATKNVLVRRASDANLVSFLSSLVSGLVKTLVIVTAITQLGIEMTSFVAILGAVGLAIGMAFSGTLSNFAGGIMILLFKPFKSGDFVKIQSEEGFVSEVTIFNTFLKTTDNKVVILPNGPVANGNITNYTKEEMRRVDWTFGVSYGDDLKVAKDTLNRYIQEDSRILKDPASLVALGELGSSSINIKVRAWVKTDDYWDVYFAMNERVYNEFGAENLNFPFPHMDVLIRKND